MRRGARGDGRQQAAGRGLLRGSFYLPTVLAGVTDEMLICREETFGPIAPVLLFGDDDGDDDGADEAVTRANATPYGLVAYVWTRGLGRTMRVAEALRFGMVTVNGARSRPRRPRSAG
ncbi:aldehyde dehydrogenase family protein [Streptomyces sp. M10(2022)]